MTPSIRLLIPSFVFALGAILCNQSFAQSVAERFQKLDKNSDAKLDSSEAGTLGF